MTETIDRKSEARKENMFPAFGLSVYERDKMADYSSAWRVVTRIVTDDLFVTNLRICEFFFTRRIADGHRGFLCHETCTLDPLTNGKELANFSSHGESRTVTEDLFVTNLRIVLHTDGYGESRRISMA